MVSANSHSTFGMILREPVRLISTQVDAGH